MSDDEDPRFGPDFCMFDEPRVKPSALPRRERVQDEDMSGSIRHKGSQPIRSNANFNEVRHRRKGRVTHAKDQSEVGQVEQGINHNAAGNSKRTSRGGNSNKTDGAQSAEPVALDANRQLETANATQDIDNSSPASSRRPTSESASTEAVIRHPSVKRESEDTHLAHDVNSTPQDHENLTRANHSIQAGRIGHAENGISIPKHQPLNTDSTASDTDAPSTERAWVRNVLYFFASLLFIWGWYSIPKPAPVDASVAHPLFTVDRWDDIQNATSFMQTSIRHGVFRYAEPIRLTVQNIRNLHHRCRSEITDLSVKLGTSVTALMQDWVFKGNCTPALTIAIATSIRDTEEVLSCMNKTISTLAQASNQTQIAMSEENNIYAAILEPFERGSFPQAQLDAATERQRETQKSISLISMMPPQLSSITESCKSEVERLLRLKYDLTALKAVVAGPNTEEVDEVIDETLSCNRRDTKDINEKFLSMVYTAIQNDTQIIQFNSRYHPVG